MRHKKAGRKFSRTSAHRAAMFSNMAASLRERIESQQRYARDLYLERARLNALFSILPVE